MVVLVLWKLASRFSMLWQACAVLAGRFGCHRVLPASRHVVEIDDTVKADDVKRFIESTRPRHHDIVAVACTPTRASGATPHGDSLLPASLGTKSVPGRPIAGAGSQGGGRAASS